MKTEESTITMDKEVGTACISTAKAAAVCHCRDVEHVGEGKNRYVIFNANATCDLRFTGQVFNSNPLHLKKDVGTKDYVSDDTKGQTEFTIWINGKQSDHTFTGENAGVDGNGMLVINIDIPKDISITAETTIKLPPTIVVP